MPALDNIRHERFCQLLVTGATHDHAYKTAGFKAETGARVGAARLLREANIQARLAELRANAEARLEAEQVQVAQQARFDRQRVLDRLDLISRTAVEQGQLSAAARCEELIGRASGFFIERHQDMNLDLNNLTSEQEKQLEAWLESKVNPEDLDKLKAQDKAKDTVQ